MTEYLKLQRQVDGSYTNDEEIYEGIRVLPEYKDIVDNILSGKSNVSLITGKAGVGKSYLIKYLKSYLSKKHKFKNIATLSFTGAAAINVGGQTIHSFFGFKTKPLSRGDIYYNQFKAPVLENLDLLIIDEVSMVRVDLIDAINRSLQMHRKNSEAFGGVKIIFLGDTLQLKPVVPENEAAFFNAKYKSPYFFDSKIFQLLDFSFYHKELTKVQRQKDKVFVDALNQIRLAEDYRESLALINRSCYGIKGEKSNIERDITLTTTNYLANKINERELNKINVESIKYEAIKKGNFKTKLLTPEILELKVGAKVMFTKNDQDNRWVNGTLGVVTALGKNSVSVKSLENNKVYSVKKETWEMNEYKMFGNNLEETPVGSFTQFPLTLAWAITIHKSQGITLDNVKIDLGNKKAFAEAHIYVALSRCKTIDGISLSRPIGLSEVFIDNDVKEFNKKLNLIAA